VIIGYDIGKASLRPFYSDAKIYGGSGIKNPLNYR
jgi:hypothetical protein